MALNSYGGPGDEERRPNPMVFGTPMQPNAQDTNGAMVTPQLGTGSVIPGMATPSMAEGGAIPEDDETGDESPNTDVVDYSNAMKIVREALNYGRAMHGLPTTKNESEVDEGGIPDESDEGDTSSMEASYAEGGAIEDEEEEPAPRRNILLDDVRASNSALPDEEQYGRPQQVNDPDRVRVPISSDNTPDLAMVPEQTAYPPGAINKGAIPEEASADVPDDSLPPPQFKGQMVNEDDLPPGEGGQQRVNPSMAMRYLESAGAAPMQTLEAYRKQADPTGGKTVAEQNLGAIQAAGGENAQAAWPLLQTQRAIYNSSIGHAFAAANGVQGKPADLNAAAASASKAYDNLLDGSTTTFRVDGDKIIAHVRLPNNSKEGGATLTPDQFKQLLDPGKAGQYDGIIEKGGALKALERAASLPSTPNTMPGMTPRNRINDANLMKYSATQPRPAAQNSGRMVTGETPQEMVTRLNSPAPGSDAAFKREALTARGNKSQRDYMGEIEARHKAKLEEDAARQKAIGDRAGSNNATRKELNDARLKEIAANREAANARSRDSNARGVINSTTMAGQKLSPEDEARRKQLMQGGPQQSAPAQQSGPPQPGMKMFNGKWYTREQYQQEFGK